MEQTIYITKVKDYFLHRGYGEVLSLIEPDILKLDPEFLLELSNLNLDSNLDKILNKLNQLDQTNRFVLYFKDQTLTYQTFKTKMQNLELDQLSKLYVEYCCRSSNLMVVNPALRKILRFIVNKIKDKIAEDKNLIGLLLTSPEMEIRKLGEKICS